MENHDHSRDEREKEVERERERKAGFSDLGYTKMHTFALSKFFFLFHLI